MDVRLRWVQFAALGLLSIVAIAWFWQDSATTVNESVEATAGPGATLTWRAGHSQQYRLLVDSDFEMMMPGGAGQFMRIQIEGELALETLSIEPRVITTGMRFSQFHLSIDGASDAAVDRAMKQPFRVLFQPDGRPVRFEFPAAMAQEHREILRNLVNMFQVVLEEGDSWEVSETNASGRYQASYDWASGQSLLKQKTHYLPGPQALALPLVESNETIEIDPQHDWVTSMVLKEVVTTDEQGSVPTRVKNVARLELLDAAQQASPAQWAFVAAEPVQDNTELAAALRALSLQEAIDQLGATVSSLDAADDGRMRLIHRVRDLLLVNDQLPAALLEILTIEELSIHTRADLYLAFELAGTVAAQEVLMHILLDPAWPPEDAMRAVVALGGVDGPTVDALNSLWILARSDLADTPRRDLPGTAALAIGSIGGQLREAEADGYHALRADLVAGAAGATRAAERAVYLYAIGNTQDSDPLLKQDVLPYLSDESSQVRSAAAITLSRIGSEQVAPQVVARLELEPSGLVRASLLEAVASLEQAPEDALTWTRQAIGSEQDERARYNMVVLLGKYVEGNPENRVVLANVLETDPSRRVRQKVADILF